jgi:phosphate transport system substrate-binding protein
MTFRKLTFLSLIVLLVSGCGRSGSGEERTVLENKGSDTLVNVAQAWAEEYQSVNANTAIAVTGGGSGTGFAALLNGTVDIANASRRIKDSERQSLLDSGVEPKEFVVGYDALALFLNNNNPLDRVTLSQLKNIYAEGGDFDNWSDLGITVPGCPSGEIVRVSRQNNSGTYVYFRSTVLDGTDYKLGSRDMHGSKDVVDLVSHTACAIGYSGLAYATDEVHMPCIETEDGSQCVHPSIDTAADGSYPISRPLFMYTRGEPTGAIKEYIDWILSDEGQCIIKQKGYAPVRSVQCQTAASDTGADSDGEGA